MIMMECFESGQELIMSASDVIGSSAVITGPHTVPGNTASGHLRMRVGMAIDGFEVEPCGGGGAQDYFGQFHDYTIFIPQEEILNGDGHFFETGWDGWTDGGSDCYRYSGYRSPEGNYSIRLRDNSGGNSSMRSPVYNTLAYDQVEVTFSFYSYSMEAAEDFWLDYSSDGGGTWTRAATFVSGGNPNYLNTFADFLNGGPYTRTVTIDNLTAINARFKFQCDASSNYDHVYIDEVIIKGIVSSNSSLATVNTPNDISQQQQWEKVELHDDKNELSEIENQSEIVDLNIETGRSTKAEIFLKISPNPFQDQTVVSFYLPNDGTVQLQIFDLTGKLISDLQATLSQGYNEFPLNDWSGVPPGIYLLKLKTEGIHETKRLIHTY